ncbi:AAA family ATPase [Cognataquiflexum aquatile]|uniref:AAA family ATPase n=1 Tax=Cognataquiflexum aquatile TaxID=2249427 RepID=UPI000DE811FF|nr:AAA family ATPase [Cognataquiflexum aquatile]
MKESIKQSIKDTNMHFSIACLYVDGECDTHLRKNVEPGYYFFNEWCELKDGKVSLSEIRRPEENFFVSNISIQAIVGKNGSGKSSILELMYRIINNLTFHLVKKQKRRAAEVLYHIEGLNADLYFVKGNTLGSIICKGDFIGFCFGDYKISFGSKRSDFSDFTFHENIKNEELIEIGKMFFYSIVTNYSLQSFIDFDYKTERSTRFQSNEKSGIDSSAIWINSLFHKNDGYLTPIVLNPYRHNGTIDLRKEYQLTNSRLSSILIESKRNKREFIEGYQLNSIEYKYEPLIILSKFNYEKNKNINLEDLILKFLNLDKRSFTSIILREYGLKSNPSEVEPHIVSKIYLVYKTLSIASKYPSFSSFNRFDNISKFEDIADDNDERDLIALVKEIKKYKSHITLKIRQTLKYLDWSHQNLSTPLQPDFDFTYNEYVERLVLNKPLKGLDEITEHLPPPFFSFNIKLEKTNLEDGKPNVPILFQRMSSGERQFIYTMSTFVYHIKNILSIQQSNRVRYRSINLILDEVELCFHPEYQRLFVDNLIRTIQRLKLNTHCSFNIIIATHSPFVLSDIPMCNILHLKNGIVQSKEQFKNPFGANINDILYQSFFLENGFIGEYARKKILKVIEQLNKPLQSIINEKENIKETISFVGEPLIQKQLQSLYNEKFNEQDEKDIVIEKLRKEIEQLQKR